MASISCMVIVIVIVIDCQISLRSYLTSFGQRIECAWHAYMFMHVCFDACVLCTCMRSCREKQRARSPSMPGMRLACLDMFGIISSVI